MQKPATRAGFLSVAGGAEAPALNFAGGGAWVGLRTVNGVLAEVLAPATQRLYWKGLVDVPVEVIDIAESAAAGLVRVLEVQPQCVG